MTTTALIITAMTRFLGYQTNRCEICKGRTSLREGIKLRYF